MSLAAYLFEINEKEDFARCSNFLNKYSKHMSMSQKETERTAFRIIDTKQDQNINAICRKIINKSLAFTKIGRPIIEFHTEYEPIFILWIDEQAMDEIVLYQDAVLIQDYFKSLPVYCVVAGKTDFYFKLSQYLYNIIENRGFRDRFFYHERGETFVKRMQKKEIVSSTSFFPLVSVTGQNLKRLKDNCIEQIGQNIANQILLQKDDTDNRETVWPELEGTLKIFSANIEVFKLITGNRLYEMIDGLDTLSWILLVYSMKNLQMWNKSIREAELQKSIEVIRQYSDACFQLLENIFFHSDTKWGIMSIRLHQSNERSDCEYLSKYYDINDKESSYFEVIIRDYSGEVLSGNVAEHFRSRLKKEEQEMFKELKPKDLFCNTAGKGDRFQEAWRKFYSKEEHICQHFGLRIFQRIVCDYEGFFIAKSHKEYQYNVGDMYSYRVEQNCENEFVMPGTSYHILLPVKSLQSQMLDKDILQEYGNWLCGKQEEFFTMKEYPFQSFMPATAFSKQAEKEKYISNMAESIRNYLNKEKNAVLTIDTLQINGKFAELYVKTLIIALYPLQEKPHIILYNCTQEFIEQFTILMKELYKINLEAMFDHLKNQVILVNEHYGETVFILGDIKKTDFINQYICRMKGTRCGLLLDQRNKNGDIAGCASDYIPADVFVKKGDVTLFQECVKKILQGNIQKEEFGCKIVDTHMRLGSTIHINYFYEAEILLGVKYFRTRFAFLILKDIFKFLKAEKKIMLYGYASYSEPLLVELKNAIRSLANGTDADYIVLEREEERRGFTHADRIRYSNQELENNEEKRKYVVIVPINSTLKTHQRLISLLEEQNPSFEKSDVIENFALILVGTKEENNYWKFVKESRLECKVGKISPCPKYYVDIATDYYEPLTCRLCFPENPLLEEPLIEVNAASTIPNQAFGMIKNREFDKKEIKGRIVEIIKREEIKLEDLESCFLYGHYERNESHYLYYLQTEKLVTQAFEKIRRSLKKWKKQFEVAENEYHILVVPMHFSNCGFVELVNDEIFSGMASIIRIDFNKDFRSNVYTKYSYIRQYIEQLGERGKVSVKFDYVDDNIITGATYFRAKSLVDSIVDLEGHYYGKDVQIELFDRIFVLVDRNSSATKKQYISNKKNYYVYLQLEISSLRNYGDSCVICNLNREAELLNQTASTGIVADYWERGKVKFGLRPIEDGVKNLDLEFQKRAFRRLQTTHIAKVVLNELQYNHQKENTMYILLNLIERDYERRSAVGKEEAFEYFISYIKVISRPFLAYDKAIKEAIFDILLNIICYMVDESYKIKGKKQDWKLVKPVWKDIRCNILNHLEVKQKKDLVLVIMKQLTELKSNYIIRKKSIECLCRFIKSNSSYFDEHDIKDFWKRYQMLVKRLTGTSSDTSKSYWLDYMIFRGREYNAKNSDGALCWESDIEERVILENTRNFRDGIDKMYQRLPFERDGTGKKSGEEALHMYMEVVLDNEYHNFCIKNMIESRRNDLLKLSKVECIEQMKQIVTDDSVCEFVKVDKLFQNPASVDEGVERCRKKFQDNSGPSDKMVKVLEMLGGIYSHEDYQYKNFQGFCKELRWFDGKKYTKEGLMQIVNCLGIKQLCNSTRNRDMNTYELKKLVNLIAGLLGYCHVQLLVECESIAEYYVDLINKQYTKACQRIGIETGEGVQIWNRKREYSALASSTGYSMYLEDAVQSLMNKPEVEEKIKEYGYFLNEDSFVWRLGYDKRYPIYLYVKYIKDETMIYRFRNLMMFKWELENSIFDIRKLGYLHEIAVANNRLKLQRGRKNVSHTDIVRRRLEFQRLAKQINATADGIAQTNRAMETNYPRDMLILLADLRVSELYRQSLTKEFFNASDQFSNICWGTEWNVLKSEDKGTKTLKNLDNNEKKGYDEKEYPVVVHPGNEWLNEPAIGAEDRLIVTEKTVDELFSLLLVLVLNSGKEKGSKKNDNKEVDVYISKTERNTLRIANPTNCEERMLPGIQWRLEHEPMQEKDGITLWSLNCFLKRIKVTCAALWLRDTGMNGDKIEMARKRIERLFEEEYQMKVDIVEGEGERFFSCEIPLLWEKYLKTE